MYVCACAWCLLCALCVHACEFELMFFLIKLQQLLGPGGRGRQDFTAIKSGQCFLCHWCWRELACSPSPPCALLHPLPSLHASLISPYPPTSSPSVSLTAATQPRAPKINDGFPSARSRPGKLARLGLLREPEL